MPFQPVSSGTLALGLQPHNYVIAGLWIFTANDPKASVSLNFAPFITGYVTPQNAMPRVGTATYTGAGGVVGIVNVASGTNASSASLAGDASFTADFFANRITGLFTNMTATDTGGHISNWNSIAVQAQIPFSFGAPNGLRGTTSVGSTPGGTFGLKSNATGYLNGYFFGPHADEIGAVWSIGNTDQTGAAFGIVAADLSAANFSQPRGDVFFYLLPTTNWTNGSTPNIPTPLAASQDQVANPPQFADANTTFNTTTPSTGFPDKRFPIRMTGFQFSSSLQQRMVRARSSHWAVATG